MAFSRLLSLPVYHILRGMICAEWFFGGKDAASLTGAFPAALPHGADSGGLLKRRRLFWNGFL